MITFRDPATGETVMIPDGWIEIQPTQLPVAFTKPGSNLRLLFAVCKNGLIALTKSVCGVEYGHSIISAEKADRLMGQLEESGWETQN